MVDTIFFGSFCKVSDERGENTTYQFSGDKNNSFGDMKIIEDKNNT